MVRIVVIKSNLEQKLDVQLEKQKKSYLYRNTNSNHDMIDFCSNDYFGFANSYKLNQKAKDILSKYSYLNGSTGSRLISGNNELIELAEQNITSFFNGKAGLIFNSGYDANIGFFSTIPNRNDTILYDELVHASIRDGIRMSYAKSYSFKHNDLNDLNSKILKSKGEIFIVVESIYSMDGDEAPIVELNNICIEKRCHLIVDEAHSTGFGYNNVFSLSEKYNIQPLARLHTFGKAMGCHGAIWIISKSLKKYLINFCRIFIYTTAPPPHSIAMMLASIDQLKEEYQLNQVINKKIQLFKQTASDINIESLLPSQSTIQSIIISGNKEVLTIAKSINNLGFNVKAIRYPTVPLGHERIRISLHTYNSDYEIKELIKHIKNLQYEKS